MKKHDIYSPYKTVTLSAFPIVALATALSGCGGASNNLPDPTASATGAIVACSSTSKTTCVTSQFIVDAPVSGLSYQCGSVNNVTDATGTVSCPDQSVATFSIQGTGGKKSITLGTYLIQSNRDVGRNATQALVNITPLDLVASSKDATSLSDANATTAVNIAQVLESLRSSSSPYTAGSPTSRLIIDSTTQDKINLLASNIIAGDFASDAAATKLAPVLAGLNTTLLSTSDTIARFNQALQAIQAGAYYTNPVLIGSLSSFSTAAAQQIATLATSSTTNDEALAGLSSVIDRSGYAIGLGVEWNGNIAPAGSSTPTAYNLLTGSNGYNRLILNNNIVNTPSFLNPVSNFVNSNFVWQSQAFSLDSNGVWQQQTTPLGAATFKNGRLLGGTYIVGSNTLWQNVSNTSTTIAPSNELATWSQNNSSITNYYNGTMNLQKSRSVDTFLDPLVFKTAANVGSGNKPIFPLYGVLTFTYTDTNKLTQTLGTQGIAILANGNIITDMNKQCLPLNANTLVDTAGTQQYRIGLVGAAFQGITNISARYISPIIVLSGQQFNALNGVQVGTINSSPSVKVNVQAALSGNVNMSDNTNVTSTDSRTGTVTVTSTGEQSVLPAQYVNYYDYWNAFKTTPTTADKISIARSAGYVTMAVSGCYNPQPAP
ncbi:MAG: hypothetical protein KGO49_11840 [Gammaproteobacteria bacterium]|nr:hypothetical protein [Gammaproteobacteria bacterium]